VDDHAVAPGLEPELCGADQRARDSEAQAVASAVVCHAELEVGPPSAPQLGVVHQRGEVVRVGYHEALVDHIHLRHVPDPASARGLLLPSGTRR